MLHVLESRVTAAIAVVGNEGITSISAFLGGSSKPTQLVVRSAGRGFRLPVAALKLAFDQGGSMARLMLQYTQAPLTQMAKMTVATGITA